MHIRKILMYLYESRCTYADLAVYIRILMYIYQSYCIYTNLDVYIPILMYVSPSCHVNNDLIVLSLFKKHSFSVFFFFFFNFACIHFHQLNDDLDKHNDNIF